MSSHATDMAKKRRLRPGDLGFVKVLMPGFSKKLSLPRKFTNNIIIAKCRRATLRSPLGKSWYIKVQGDIEDLHFGDGWQEFVRAHGLAVGFFLVFNHEGDMVFNVQIFDRSLCMKLYDSISGPGAGYGTLTQDFNCRDYLAVSQLNTKYSAEADARNNESLTKDFSCRDNLAIPQINWKCSRDVNAHNGELEAFSIKRLCASRPSFKATMNRSNLHIRKPYMNIPREFRKINNISIKREIVLIDPEGREWPVKLYKGDRAQMGTGWQKFMMNNKLKLHDECTFELLYEHNRVVMHVSIVRKHG